MGWAENPTVQRFGRGLSWVLIATGAVYLPADLLGAAQWVADRAWVLGWVGGLPSSTWFSPVLVFVGVVSFGFLVRADRNRGGSGGSMTLTVLDAQGNPKPPKSFWKRRRLKHNPLPEPVAIGDHEVIWVGREHHLEEGWQAKYMQMHPVHAVRQIATWIELGGGDGEGFEELYCVIEPPDKPPAHIDNERVRYSIDKRTNSMTFYMPQDVPRMDDKWPLDPGEYKVSWMAAGTKPRPLCRYKFTVLPDGRVIPDE